MTTIAAGKTPGIGTRAEAISEYRQTYPGQADQVRNVRRDAAKHLGECPAADSAVLIASDSLNLSICSLGPFLLF